MARTTFVKAAKARYATVPVIDPATGEQKITPVMRADGSQKVTKHGKPVVLRVTTADRTQPLPNNTCGKCGVEIKVGDSYKWIKPKSGPYGGHQMVRCGTCPVWNVWEYSSSLSSRIAQISHSAWDSFPEDATDTSDIESWLEGVADEVDELAQEKAESATNIEDGFGHETSTSQELADVAEQLEGWAEEIRGASIPDVPDVEDQECDECGGTGKVENPDYDATDEDEQDEEVSCDECDGTGEVTPDEPTEDQMNDWLEEVRDAVSVVDDSPL